MATSPASSAGAGFEVTGYEESQLMVAVSGRLDAESLRLIWSKAVQAITSARPSELVVDLNKVEYCDGAGLGLFAEMRRLVAGTGGEVKYAGMTDDLRSLIAMAALEDPQASVLEPPPRQGMVVQVGEASAGILHDMRDIVAFTGEMVAALGWAILNPLKVRGRDLWVVAEKVGVNALGVVVLLGALVGMILAFQAVLPLQRFGAVSAVPMLIGIAITREMGPLITAVILAGRTGSAFAAEIGTMKVTEELSALESFGLDPLRFLVIPRVLAAILMTPLLTVFNVLASIVGGYVVMADHDYTFGQYMHGVFDSLTVADYAGGIAKTFVFGLIVAAIGCLHGLKTRSGPGAVGDSTTRAVVAGIVLIVCADMVFGVVYYYLGF